MNDLQIGLRLTDTRLDYEIGLRDSDTRLNELQIRDWITTYRLDYDQSASNDGNTILRYI